MRKQAIWLMLLAGGCGPYTRAELDLVDQARHGVKLAADAQEIQARQNEATATERRARLDEAFDADVRERKSLDVDWVIAQRRAYAAAMDALARQSSSAVQLQQTARKNLTETDALLERLGWMLKVQDNFFESKEAK